MRAARSLIVLMFALVGCSSPPEKPSPPAGFPDLGEFTAVDTEQFRVAGTSFVTPNQVRCMLDHGPYKSVICDGHIAGFPENIPGGGCPVARRPDGADTIYPLPVLRTNPLIQNPGGA